MSTKNLFTTAISEWLHNNNFENINLSFDRDFGFDIEDKTIYLGTEDCGQVFSFYEDFLSNLGCGWTDLPEPMLAFLHELGHSQTIHTFSEEKLGCFCLIKVFINTYDEYDQPIKDGLFAYWRVADELAACTWEAEFLNNHIEAVLMLIKIFQTYWNKLMEELNV